MDQDLDEITLFNPKINAECCHAPEIFTSEGKTKIIDYQTESAEVEILKKSDVFSVACMIYSVLNKGTVLFNYLKLK